MPRAYLPLKELVAAFFENGSRTQGYVWRAIAEHASPNCWDWVPDKYGLIDGEWGDSRFPADTFEDGWTGEVIAAGAVAEGIVTRRLDHFDRLSPGFQFAPDPDHVWVKQSAIDAWCTAFRFSSPLKPYNEIKAGFSSGPLWIADLPDDLRDKVPDYGSEHVAGRTQSRNASLRDVKDVLGALVAWAKPNGEKLKEDDARGRVEKKLGGKVPREFWRKLWREDVPAELKHKGRPKKPAETPAENLSTG
ncbi:MAG: hypothetical protein IV100_09090 [Myxococcales bacterium]|nr:hypothetical protein [Myxococcales bacterium]